jgi:hypothetical protein
MNLSQSHIKIIRSKLKGLRNHDVNIAVFACYIRLHSEYVVAIYSPKLIIESDSKLCTKISENYCILPINASFKVIKRKFVRTKYASLITNEVIDESKYNEIKGLVHNIDSQFRKVEQYKNEEFTDYDLVNYFIDLSEPDWKIPVIRRLNRINELETIQTEQYKIDLHKMLIDFTNHMEDILVTPYDHGYKLYNKFSGQTFAKYKNTDFTFLDGLHNEKVCGYIYRQALERVRTDIASTAYALKNPDDYILKISVAELKKIMLPYEFQNKIYDIIQLSTNREL